MTQQESICSTNPEIEQEPISEHYPDPVHPYNHSLAVSWLDKQISLLPEGSTKKYLERDQEECLRIDLNDPISLQKSWSRSFVYWEWKYRILSGALRFLSVWKYIMAGALVAMTLYDILFPS